MATLERNIIPTIPALIRHSLKFRDRVEVVDNYTKKAVYKGKFRTLTADGRTLSVHHNTQPNVWVEYDLREADITLIKLGKLKPHQSLEDKKKIREAILTAKKVRVLDRSSGGVTVHIMKEDGQDGSFSAPIKSLIFDNYNESTETLTLLLKP